MTDITELARVRQFDAWWEREYKHLESSKYTDAVPHIKYGFWMAYQAGGAELVEAVEKAQGMETYWKTQCRGITDHCEELQARIAELESHTVKPPIHPTVASEKLDDETLQELIEFRRTTFEYHSKEGNKVQTIIHGVTLAALRELQERRKAVSEPVATLDVQSRRPDGNKFALVFSSAAHKLPDDVYFLYRHAQPAPEKYNIGDATMRHIFTPTGMTNVSDMQAVFDRVEAVFVGMEQPAPVVPDGLLSMAASAIEDLLEHTDPNTSYYSGVWADVPGKLRATMIAAAPQDEAKKDKPHNNFGTGARLTNHRFKV
ncbi:hypothetical protein [Raoultella planticola]|uniref:hypothetical protein n=1 Tax=Raoultella planticola TaxID=575 RepID=UPI001F538391|nr:hypothetical protein [Raoultella planticola]UNK75807.1 hypothetical protein MNO12_04300 [Raoultella planticola]